MKRMTFPGLFGAALLVVLAAPATAQAPTPTVEIARKCSVLTAKAYPPRQVGNPASGSSKGSGKAERDYFRNCMANNGNVDDHAPANPK